MSEMERLFFTPNRPAAERWLTAASAERCRDRICDRYPAIHPADLQARMLPGGYWGLLCLDDGGERWMARWSWVPVTRHQPETLAGLDPGKG